MSDNRREDQVIKKVTERVGNITIQSTNNVFHDLVSCIIEQQIHYRSTKKVFEKMLLKSGLPELTIENVEVFEKMALANAKLSERKWETLNAIVEFFRGNQIQFSELLDTEVRERLGEIRGVGKWTVDMILLYTLERSNIFPQDDYHLKQIMSQLYNLESTNLKQQMETISTNWEPEKSKAVLALFKYKKLGLLSTRYRQNQL